jgi:hypothetical protein
MATAQTEAIKAELEGISGKKKDHKHLSHEALVLLITAERLHKLEGDSRRELLELKERQHKVNFLHKLTKTLHAATSSKGDLDLSKLKPEQLNEMQTMFKAAKDLGVELDEDKHKYNNEERERLLESIRMTIEDFNVQNEMQLQMVTRLTNERYESYQMARNILKPLHDDKMNKARALSGR